MRETRAGVAEINEARPPPTFLNFPKNQREIAFVTLDGERHGERSRSYTTTFAHSNVYSQD